jgi:hypothetical protein
MNAESENMELLQQQHDCRKFYKEINVARKQFKPKGNICKNEDGSLISSEQEILNRWVRHFNKLLNESNDKECPTLLP